MNNLRFYLLGLTPLILALLVWSLNPNLDFAPNPNGDSQDTDSTGQANALTSMQSAPDAIVINPVVSQYNLEGQVQQVVTGAELQSFAKGDLLQIVQPKFLLNEPGGNQWNISANSGYFTPDENLFDLSGDVLMLRQSPDLPINLSTDQLEIDLDRKIISTEAAILIEAPGHRLAGEGFQASMESNSFKILNRVRSTHETL